MRLLSSITAAALTVTIVICAAGRAQAAVPALLISASAAPVGAEITIDTTQLGGMSCGNVVFGVAKSNTAAVSVAPGSPGRWQILVPSFVNGAPGQMVTPGNWTFAVSCQATSSSPVQNFDAVLHVTSATVAPTRFSGIASTPDGGGYWLVQMNGGVRGFGDAGFFGSLPSLHVTPAAPVVGIVPSPDGRGYLLAGADGGVFAFGDAHYAGSGKPAAQAPVVGIAATSSGRGYWLAGADGAVYPFGTAHNCPGLPAASGATQGGPASGPWPIAGIATDRTGSGYVLTDTSGTGAVFEPTTPCPAPGQPPTASFTLPRSPVAAVSAVGANPDQAGPWLTGLDGGVFAPALSGSGKSARYYGSLPGLRATPSAPIIGLASTPDGGGYWLLGADGGVFNFGDARFHGSASGSGPW